MRPSQSLIPLLITFWLALSAALPPNRWIAAASHTHSQPTVDASCQAYDILHDFIQENRISKNDFKVQGWRWHTLSLIREARRLAKAATNTSLDLTQAIEYVVGFNMQGLHKIQDELFFPWVRQQIQQRAAPHIAQAFATVIDELEAQEQECRRLGKLLLVSQRWWYHNYRRLFLPLTQYSSIAFLFLFLYIFQYTTAQRRVGARSGESTCFPSHRHAAHGKYAVGAFGRTLYTDSRPKSLQ